MLRLIFESLWIFLPAYVANATPVLLARFRLLEFMNKPIDHGFKLGKNRLFGETKTWRGLIGGSFAALLITAIQYSYETGLSYKLFLLMGLTMGLGVGLMDLFKSFVKRRFNIESTKPWFPFDHMDYLGGLAVLNSLMGEFMDYRIFWCILIISPIMPILANMVSYKLGWKKVWW